MSKCMSVSVLACSVVVLLGSACVLEDRAPQAGEQPAAERAVSATLASSDIEVSPLAEEEVASLTQPTQAEPDTQACTAHCNTNYAAQVARCDRLPTAQAKAVCRADAAAARAACFKACG